MGDGEQLEESIRVLTVVPGNQERGLEWSHGFKSIPQQGRHWYSIQYL